MDTRDITFNAPYLQEEQEDFESDNLAECLNYYRETKDFQPLAIAIENTQDKLTEAVKDIQFLMELAHQTNLTYYANKLLSIRKKLEL